MADLNNQSYHHNRMSKLIYDELYYYNSINHIYDLIDRLTLEDVLESSKLNYILWQNSKMSYRKQAIEIINIIK